MNPQHHLRLYPDDLLIELDAPKAHFCYYYFIKLPENENQDHLYDENSLYALLLVDPKSQSLSARLDDEINFQQLDKNRGHYLYPLLVDEKSQFVSAQLDDEIYLYALLVVDKIHFNVCARLDDETVSNA